jgi:hypothetical protein
MGIYPHPQVGCRYCAFTSERDIRPSTCTSKKSDILSLNMPTSLRPVPHHHTSSRSWLTWYEIIGTVIAKPRFFFGSCGIPDASGAHHPPMRIWVTGLRTGNKMQNLGIVLANVISKLEKLWTYAVSPRTMYPLKTHWAACADEEPVQLLEHRYRRRRWIQLQFSDKGMRSRRATLDKF